MEARHVIHQMNLDDIRVKNLKEFCVSTEVFVVVYIQATDNAIDERPIDINTWPQRFDRNGHSNWTYKAH